LYLPREGASILTRERRRGNILRRSQQKRRDLHPQKFNAFNSEQREKVVESKTPGCYHYRREKEEEEEVSVKQSHNAPDTTSCLRLLPREREKERKRIVTERID
jgi:hypothetical protein